jgi:hypothetical protein
MLSPIRTHAYTSPRRARGALKSLAFPVTKEVLNLPRTAPPVCCPGTWWLKASSIACNLTSHDCRPNSAAPITRLVTRCFDYTCPLCMQIAVIPVSLATPRHFVTTTEFVRNNNAKTSAYVTRSCLPDPLFTLLLVSRYAGRVCLSTHGVRRVTSELIPCFQTFSFLLLFFLVSQKPCS